MKYTAVEKSLECNVIDAITKSFNDFFDLDIRRFKVYHNQRCKQDSKSDRLKIWKNNNFYDKQEIYQLCANSLCNQNKNRLSLECVYSRSGIRQYTLTMKGDSFQLLDFMQALKVDSTTLNKYVNDYFKLMKVLSTPNGGLDNKQSSIISGDLTFNFVKKGGLFNLSSICFIGQNTLKVIMAKTSQGRSQLSIGSLLVKNISNIHYFSFEISLENNRYKTIDSRSLALMQQDYLDFPDFLSALRNQDISDICQLLEMSIY